MKSKKLLPVILFSLALFFILLLTFQSSEKSAKLSGSLLDWIYRMEYATGLYKYDFIGYMKVDYSLFRKLAHIAEYFLLGIASMLLFRKSPGGLLKAIALCAFVSLSDQTIKAFLPGREFDWTDFPYDIAGYLSGAVISSFFRKKNAK